MPPLENPSHSNTQYTGPITVTEHRVAGHTIRLARPEAPDRLLDQTDVIDWNRRDDYMPYWAYLWPGANLLADVIATEPIPQPSGTTEEIPLRVLEIGCGLGLAGLVALSRGFRVVFSDYDEAPFAFITRSIAENRLDAALAEMQRIDWRSPPPDRYSLVIGSDVLYEKRLVPLVAELLSRILEPEGVALIASTLRVAAEGFPAAAAERGLRCQNEPLTGIDERGDATRGTLFRVKLA